MVSAARAVSSKIRSTTPIYLVYLGVLKLTLHIYINAISIDTMYDSMSTVIFFIPSVSQK